MALIASVPIPQIVCIDGDARKLQPKAAALLKDVFSLYTSQSVQLQRSTLTSRYQENASFKDPAVAVKGRDAIGLQFYALMLLFSQVVVAVSNVVVDEEDHVIEMVAVNQQTYWLPWRLLGLLLPSTWLGDNICVRWWGLGRVVSYMECLAVGYVRLLFVYSPLARLVPRTIVLQATTVVQADKATMTVVTHQDCWTNWWVVPLPLPVRRLLAALINLAARLLMWLQAERLLVQAPGPGA